MNMINDEYDFMFKDIVESAQDIVIVTENNTDDITQQKIVYVNPAFTNLMGFSFEEVIGENAKLLDLFKDETVRQEVKRKLAEKLPIEITVQTFSKDREEHWLHLVMIPLNDKQGDCTYFASIERDITKEKRLLLELEEKSRTDPLTGLANRRNLIERAEIEIARAVREKLTFSFLSFDLDYFKKVNDTFGHPAGDKVLIAVADKLQHLSRAYDVNSRTGGEEFCVLLSNTNIKDAGRFAERVRKSISEIIVYEDGNKIVITASIGVVKYNSSDKDINSIWERADKALYQAKDSGRNCVVVCED
ncbi:MAG: diguanylate cyclase (GGDEF)-like protein/PAS domain S-box-containing protein [Gammaproteobacteria bacterium]|jgi:diguanylate cyclase (GGDEF)-like protein/PAS domain S-box-containing protein